MVHIRETIKEKINVATLVGTVDDYVRMFAGSASLANLLSDIFLGYYDALGVLSVQDEDSWISFLPKKVQNKTLQEGKKLFTSRTLCGEYRRAFEQYIRSSTSYFNSVLAHSEITADEVKRFLELASQHFELYSKTEFFYTDLLDQGRMALTVPEFEKLKLDGRSHLNKIIFEDKGFVRALLRKLAQQTGIPDTDLVNYGIGEIIELVQNGRVINEEILKSRGVFFASKDLIKFGEQARPLVNAFLFPYRAVSNVIKGTIANHGFVRGKAFVLRPDFKNFEKVAAAVDEMREGEVLVAETTSPEIIQACKKASAIITNQGGILSHAAIVSRELGIPCIIGTEKDVTLNIKTGDELEVDADHGIVRIITPKKK